MPDYVKVGDEGIFSTDTTYSNSSKTSILDKITTSYKVEDYFGSALVIFESIVVDSNGKEKNRLIQQFAISNDEKNNSSLSLIKQIVFSIPGPDTIAVFIKSISSGVGGDCGGGSGGTSTAPVANPTITTQPAMQTVAAGETATFSVTAAGTAPLIYQWQKNSTDISGATSSTYTTPATSSADNGALYSVVVFNGAGTATSNQATLTVSAAGVIGTRFSLVAKASGGTYDKTECVKDNSTGLVWEGKTASPATSRLGTSYYTNYDSTSSAQKWNGTNPTQTEIDAITNSIGYKNSVNTSALCGYTDWRMPTKEELQGILASSGIPKIDTTWFPNTRASFYWSSSPYVGNSSYAWSVYFDDGGVDVSGYLRVSISRVRLVR